MANDGKAPTLGPISRITNVHWSPNLYAVISMCAVTSHTSTGALVTPPGLDLTPPALNFDPVRFSPDSGAAPYVFPPSALMTEVYDAWADQTMLARRPAGLSDATLSVWVVNLGRIGKETKLNTVKFKITMQNGLPQVPTPFIGRFVYQVRCQLFTHSKWRKNITEIIAIFISDPPWLEVLSPHTGPFYLPQAGQKEPIFNTSIDRDSLQTAFQMTDNNDMADVTITIDRAKKTATITPFT